MLLNKIYKFLINYGPATTARHSIWRIRESLFPHTRLIFCAHLADINFPSELEDQQVKLRAFQSLREIPPADLEELFLHGTISDRKPCSMERVKAFLKELFSQGAVFWFCYEGNSIVGYLWSLRGSQEVTRFYFFPLIAQDAILFAHEVFPPYRGRGLNRKMTRKVLAELRTLGIERVYIDVLTTNLQSLKSFSKTLFVPIGLARKKRFKKSQIVFWK